MTIYTISNLVELVTCRITAGD